METKHTPGPWHQKHTVGIFDGFGREILWIDVRGALGDIDTREANAARIVACVNACEGINPEAVKDLLEALEAIKKEAADLGDGAPDAPYLAKEMLNIEGIAKAAIAKAKGAQT